MYIGCRDRGLRGLLDLILGRKSAIACLGMGFEWSALGWLGELGREGVGQNGLSRIGGRKRLWLCKLERRTQKYRPDF